MPKNELRWSDAVSSLADLLAEGDDALSAPQLQERLRSAGVDSEVRRRHYLEQIAPAAIAAQSARLQAAGQSSAVLRAERWADNWIQKFPSQLMFVPQFQASRAFRRSRQLSDNDYAELEKLEAALQTKWRRDQPKEVVDFVHLLSQAFLRRFGIDCGGRLPEIAGKLGVEIVYRRADGYDGALLRIRGVERACIIINSDIREDTRKRFTLAHELGHYLLPNQQELAHPCSREKIESWNERLYAAEQEANRFAGEILMPEDSLRPFFSHEPSFDSIRAIARLCRTSLSASAVRLIALTGFPAAVVWSTNKRVLWLRSSRTFTRWIRRGEMRNGSIAARAFRNESVPKSFTAVPADAWLFERGLRTGAHVWECSLRLPSYDAVLTLLVLREPVE